MNDYMLGAQLIVKLHTVEVLGSSIGPHEMVDLFVFGRHEATGLASSIMLRNFTSPPIYRSGSNFTP